jgi:hypothetical protein
MADAKRIGADRFGDVLELRRAEIADSEIEPPLDLPVGRIVKRTGDGEHRRNTCRRSDRFGDGLQRPRRFGSQTVWQ